MDVYMQLSNYKVPLLVTKHVRPSSNPSSPSHLSNATAGLGAIGIDHRAEQDTVSYNRQLVQIGREP